MVAIVDYGVGNLFSLESSFAAIGAECVVSSDPQVLEKADKLILPGVGAFADAAKKLRDSGLDIFVKEQAALGKPLLGICRGMQEIACFMGAALIEDLGELNAIHKAQTNGASRQHAILLSDGQRLMVNSRHHQAIDSVPMPCTLEGRAEDGTLELLQSADGQLLLVQCHPEREEMRGTAIEQMCLEFIIHS